MASLFQILLCLLIAAMVKANSIERILGIANESVTMPCDLSGTNGSLVYWYSKSLDQYISSQRVVRRELPTDLYSRLEVMGSNNRYDLDIFPLRVTDGGVYRCQIYGEKTQELVKSIVYEVIVHAAPLPQYPECLVRSSGIINDLANLSCASRGGVPPARLEWFRGDELLESVSDIATNTITYNKTLIAEDNGVNYTCRAWSPVLTEVRECTVTLLSVPPTVTLTQSHRRVSVNGEVTYRCAGVGMPSVSYRWLTNNLVVPEDSSRIKDGGRALHLQNASMTDNGTVVTCQVITPTGLMSSQGKVLLVTDNEASCHNKTTNAHVQSKLPIIAILVAFAGGIGLTLLCMIVIKAVLKRRRRRRDLRAKRAEELWSSKHSEYSTMAEPTSGQDIFTKDSAFVTSSNGLQSPPSPQNVQNIQAQKNQYFEMHSGGFRESSATFPKSGPRNDYQMRSTAPSPPISPLNQGAFGYENVGRGSGTDVTDISHSEISVPGSFARAPIYMDPRAPTRAKPQSPLKDRRSQSLQRVTYDAVPTGMRRDPDFKRRIQNDREEQPEYTEIDCVACIPVRDTYEASIISNFEL